MLVVISGLPGTGKTAVAAEVARDAEAVHLSIMAPRSRDRARPADVRAPHLG